MSQTKLTNLINPEVMAQMIAAELPHKIKFAKIANVDNTLVARAGNTITVPKFAYIGDAADVAEGVALGTTVLTASTTQATVKKAGKAVELTDEAVLSAHGDIVGEATRQLTMAVASKVDADCVEALEEATLVHDASSEYIGYEGIVNAVDKFNEEDLEPRVIFVHPAQVTQLRKDADFKDINKYPLQTIMSGVIGEICGCQVVASRRVKAEGSVYHNPIVKAGALTIYMKRGAQVETDRDILASTTVIKADEHYVSVLSDDSKVVMAKFKK